MGTLDEEIKKAEEACNKEFPSETSLVDRMRPWVHLNNLLWAKIQHLIYKDNGKNRQP